LLERLAYAPFPLIEGVMEKLLFSLFAVVVLSGTFLADAVAAFPSNDWQHLLKKGAKAD